MMMTFPSQSSARDYLASLSEQTKYFYCQDWTNSEQLTPETSPFSEMHPGVLERRGSAAAAQ